MRIQLSIDHLPNQKLPINYQYVISSYIYKTLHTSDSEFSQWLHEKGYTLNGKKYKHFCFSTLKPKRYKIHQKEKIFELVEAPTQLILSFNIDKAAKNMVKGLFQNNMIQLKSGQFEMLGMVNQVQLLPQPEFLETMRFKTITPICISVGGEERQHAEYLHPTDERFAEAFAANLADKANAYWGEEKFKASKVLFKSLTENPKSKLWTIKGISVKAYELEFELTAPTELMEIGCNSGFGIQNSALGMGMCERIEKD